MKLLDIDNKSVQDGLNSALSLISSLSAEHSLHTNVLFGV